MKKASDWRSFSRVDKQKEEREEPGRAHRPREDEESTRSELPAPRLVSRLPQPAESRSSTSSTQSKQKESPPLSEIGGIP